MADLLSVGIALFITGLVTLVLTLGYWLRLLPSGRLDPQGKAIVITGCGRGFGSAIAKRLDSLGCHVFAGCLDAQSEGARKLREETSERLVVVQMDVTNEEQVMAAMEVVKDKMPHPEKGLWGVVNNAGVDSCNGMVEWYSVEDAKRSADVNVYGFIRVIKTFLPLIKKANGRIVNTGSILGRYPCFGTSAYTLTKYAVEGFTQCLRLEMRRFGIDVCIVEPGDHRAATSIVTEEKAKAMKLKMWSKMSDSIRQEYGKEYFDNFFSGSYSPESLSVSNPTCDDVIECTKKALFDKRPRVRYCATSWKEALKTFVVSHFPEPIGDYYYYL